MDVFSTKKWLGKGPATKLAEFLEKFQMAFDPPHFCIFCIMDMVAFMQGGIGQIVSVNINTIVEKTYPEPWNYSSFYQFHALFQVPKICNIWLKNWLLLDWIDAMFMPKESTAGLAKNMRPTTRTSWSERKSCVISIGEILKLTTRTWQIQKHQD